MGKGAVRKGGKEMKGLFLDQDVYFFEGGKGPEGVLLCRLPFLPMEN